jgi:hypothetical protein
MNGTAVKFPRHHNNQETGRDNQRELHISMEGDMCGRVLEERKAEVLDKIDMCR